METVDRSPPSPEAIREGHESSDPSVNWIWIFLLGLLVVGVVIELVLRSIMGHFVTVEKRTSVAPPRYSDTSGLFPGPKLQDNPNDELQRINKEMALKLGDDARIPLERAMQLIAERGLPDRGDAAKRTNDAGK